MSKKTKMLFTNNTALETLTAGGFKRGEVWAITGANNSGVTTTLRTALESICSRKQPDGLTACWITSDNIHADVLPNSASSPSKEISIWQSPTSFANNKDLFKKLQDVHALLNMELVILDSCSMCEQSELGFAAAMDELVAWARQYEVTVLVAVTGSDVPSDEVVAKRIPNRIRRIVDGVLCQHHDTISDKYTLYVWKHRGVSDLPNPVDITMPGLLQICLPGAKYINNILGTPQTGKMYSIVAEAHNGLHGTLLNIARTAVENDNVNSVMFIGTIEDNEESLQHFGIDWNEPKLTVYQTMHVKLQDILDVIGGDKPQLLVIDSMNFAHISDDLLDVLSQISQLASNHNISCVIGLRIDKDYQLTAKHMNMFTNVAYQQMLAGGKDGICFTRMGLDIGALPLSPEQLQLTISTDEWTEGWTSWGL